MEKYEEEKVGHTLSSGIANILEGKEEDPIRIFILNTKLGIQVVCLLERSKSWHGTESSGEG